MAVVGVANGWLSDPIYVYELKLTVLRIELYSSEATATPFTEHMLKPEYVMSNISQSERSEGFDHSSDKDFTDRYN
jgi:hypothetical protein